MNTYTVSTIQILFHIIITTKSGREYEKGEEGKSKLGTAEILSKAVRMDEVLVEVWKKIL